MSNNNQPSNRDPFNRFYRNMSPEHRFEVIRIYRGYGEHYTSVVNRMSNMLFNWAFTLNTGGLVATIAFIGATLGLEILSKLAILYIFLILVFCLGILFTCISGILEHKRFLQKGEILDSTFDDFQDNKITGNAFFNTLPPKLECLDKATSLFLKLSFFIFALGLLVGIISLFLIALL